MLAESTYRMTLVALWKMEDRPTDCLICTFEGPEFNKFPTLEVV